MNLGRFFLLKKMFFVFVFSLFCFPFFFLVFFGFTHTQFVDGSSFYGHFVFLSLPHFCSLLEPGGGVCVMCGATVLLYALCHTPVQVRGGETIMLQYDSLLLF